MLKSKPWRCQLKSTSIFKIASESKHNYEFCSNSWFNKDFFLLTNDTPHIINFSIKGCIKEVLRKCQLIRNYARSEHIYTVWKVSKYGVISGPYFPAVGMNTGKGGPEITPYLDTFHAVLLNKSLMENFNICKIFLSELCFLWLLKWWKIHSL